jgi:hypothetical protein
MGGGSVKSAGTTDAKRIPRGHSDVVQSFVDRGGIRRSRVRSSGGDFWRSGGGIRICWCRMGLETKRRVCPAALWVLFERALRGGPCLDGWRMRTAPRLRRARLVLSTSVGPPPWNYPRFRWLALHLQVLCFPPFRCLAPHFQVLRRMVLCFPPLRCLK